MTLTRYDELKSVLMELFQFDRADLDFGIYRIMNQKRGEITRFLDNDLKPQVERELAEQRGSEAAELKAELAKLLSTLSDAGVDAETSPKVKELRAKIKEAGDPERLSEEIFSDLAAFFRRYYDKGDFISQRRYKKDVYAIPYEGEEVKLYWANSDQYYIKSGEYFRDYTFAVDGGKRCVHFKIVDADVERNNNKAQEGKERRFILCETEPITVENGALILRFEYRTDDAARKQPALNELASKRILSAPEAADWHSALSEPAPTEKAPKRTLLDKKLGDYTARNTFDYFIHKNLGGFLRRELDFYIKSEIIQLDDIESETLLHVEQYLGKIRVLRRLAHKIIDLLAQLENFQKSLWLKKKFVVETGWCITLGHIDEKRYAEIAANDAQRAEWVHLFAIDEITQSRATPAYSAPLSVDFLKAHPNLVLDTKFFAQEFVETLLSEIDDLDESTDGLIINSENFQALNLLQERYREQVKCIYIDPPYNTGDSEILYKNEYINSSWLSLIDNRLESAEHLSGRNSVLFVAIDDFEMANLAKLIDLALPNYQRDMIVVNHHPQGGKAITLAQTHEYMLVCTRRENALKLSGRAPDGDTVEQRPFKRSGTAESNFRYGRPNSFYAILVNPDTKQVIGLEPPPVNTYPTKPRDNGSVRIYPISANGEERVWRRSYESCLKLLELGKLTCTDSLTIYQNIEAHEKTTALFSNWIDRRYNAGTYGANLLGNILGIQNLFSYPKSINTVQDSIFAIDTDDAIILDYFAGSGTTGHAVINLNREDDGQRKYILVEMGEYFDTVLKPRILKVIYSKDWKDGRPVSRVGDEKHIVKYLRLESYEDTLNNLAFRRTSEQETMLAENSALKEDYLLHYALDEESRGSGSRLSIAAFTEPFDCALQISTGSAGETRPTLIDLVETFNYLIGLRVSRIETVNGFRLVYGSSPSNENILVVWRSLKEKSNKDLESFFERIRIAPRDGEFDVIYVNGDNNLENLRRPDESWKVRLIEQEFLRLMFQADDDLISAGAPR